MKKKMCICIMAAVLLSLSIFQYKRINKGVPRKYVIDSYCMGQKVKLDDAEVKAEAFKEQMNNKETDGNDDISCTLQLNIKNTGKADIDISPLIEDSKLSLGLYYVDYAEVSGDLKKVKNLHPGSEANLSLTYSFNNKDYGEAKENNFKFYIGEKLYKNQILEKVKHLNLYGKYIELKETS